MTPKQKILLLHGLHQLYSTRDFKGIHDNLFEKLDLLGYLHEALPDNSVILKDNEQLLESLIIKFYMHGMTVCNISKGFNINSFFFDTKTFPKLRFIDISSLLTVGRAQMETFLMYQHLYINDSNDDEQRLRYDTWIYTAILQRINFPRTANFDIERLKESQLDLETLKSSIIENLAFKNLSAKQQKGLLEKGTSKCFKTWDKIFEESKFPKNGIVSKFYYILSSHAHSEGLSAMQLKSNKYFLNGKNNQDAVFLQIVSSWYMTAIMVQHLVSRFQVVKDRFEKIDEKIKYEVDFLSKIPKSMEKI